MTHDEQKRAAIMASIAVEKALECYMELGRCPQPMEIEVICRHTEQAVMNELSDQRIAREAGEYVAGSGMVN